MKNTFKVRFKHTYSSPKHGKIVEDGEIIDVLSANSKPSEWDVVEALKKKLGTSDLGLGSVSMWEVI